MMPELSPWQWALAALGGLVTGISRTGLPGIGTLAVPLFAMALPPRASTGALVPLLVVGDLFAIAWYRRNAVWPHLLRLLPAAGLGVVLGFLALNRIGDRELKYLIGALVLALQAFSLWRSARAPGELIGAGAFWLAMCLGVLAGAATMMANAAGPIILVYLLMMRLPKKEFLGTSAWFYFCINLFKLPFSAGLGLITPGSLLFDLALAPSVVAGIFIGLLLVRRIQEKTFYIVVQLLTAASAAKLFF
jgi:hypothetical protein